MNFGRSGEIPNAEVYAAASRSNSFRNVARTGKETGWSPSGYITMPDEEEE